ncbi:MAG: amidohydrolase family protein [Nannocystaceae bacterium]
MPSPSTETGSSTQPPTTDDPPTESSETGEGGSGMVFKGGSVPELGQVDIAVDKGVITQVGPDLPTPSGTIVVDVSGHYLVPSFIDSHVHLAYLPSSATLGRRGIAAAIDLAAPAEFLTTPVSPIAVLRSGPMVTAVGGYPTQGWGADGYGVECADAPAVEAAIDELVNQGANLIKVPVTSSPVLDNTALAQAATTAHGHGLKVATHALSDNQALAAGQANFDVLAHTPTEALSEQTIELWGERAVVTTLAAFGGSATRANLRALADAGALILYGTDLGNTRDAGIQVDEVQYMLDAGFTATEILAAGTSTPAAYWGFDNLGALAVGKDASFLVVAEDPLANPLTLAQPVEVYLHGSPQ